MRRLTLAIALACVLSSLARAGEIHSTGAVAAPPQTTVTVAGEMHPNGATTPAASSTVLTIILTLISISR